MSMHKWFEMIGPERGKGEEGALIVYGSQAHSCGVNYLTLWCFCLARRAKSTIVYFSS